MNFRVVASPKLCNCDLGGKTLGTSRNLAKAAAIANGHWLIYLTFLSDSVHWIDMLIVDTRDGVVMWRNGRPTEQGKERLDVEAGQRKDDKPGKR